MIEWPILSFGSAALAMLVERFAGYPKQVFDTISHPVVWIGALIERLDRSLNTPTASAAEGRLRGVGPCAADCRRPHSHLDDRRHPLWLAARLGGGGAARHQPHRPEIDARPCPRRVEGVGRSLPEARKAVSLIVGRDPSQLDESGVSRAALESLAENTSDGIVAPVLWYVLLGLPGIAVYKAINTADSMIGHKSEKYLHFGWAAARLDDLVNLPASRLTGLLFAATEPKRFREIVGIMQRDAPKHGSPNAGWPEAAMAAALGLKFGGPRAYAGETVALPWMGEGRTEITRHDIKRGLRLYGKALWLLFAGLVALAIVT